MADETRPSLPEPLAPPPRESVKLDLVDAPKPDESPAERTFATSATRLRLDDDEHDELSRLLEKSLSAIERERADLEWDGNWDLWEDLYFGVLQDRPAGQANVHVPLSQEVVDTFLAVTEQVLFTSPWMQVMPREQMDVDTAKRKEQWLDFALTVEMQAKERLEPILWEAAVLGTGVGYLPWLRESERIRDEETYDGQRESDMARFAQRYPHADRDHPEVVAKLKRGEVARMTVEYSEARQDAPELTYVPLRDWLVRPTAQWHKLHRERFVGHKYPLRYADIEEQTRQKYFDESRLSRLAFKYDDKNERVDDPDFQDKRYDLAVGTVRWRRPNDVRERRYLVEYHRESKTVLRALHYPYWHNRPNYIPFYAQRSRRFIYGVSLIQKVEHSQFEANAAHSLTLDAVAFGAIPMFKARTGTEGKFNPMRDGMYAGKTWYFDNPDQDANAFQVGVNSGINVLMNLEDRAARHAELSSGASQNLSGLESARDPDAPGNKTAILVQQAQTRIAKYLGTLGWSFSELGFQASELYYQFSPTGRVYRVMGPEGTPVFETMPRQEMRLRADFLPHTSTAAMNPGQEKRDTLQTVELLMKVPEVAQSALKRLALLEAALDVMGSAWAQKKHKVLPGAEEMTVIRQEEELALQKRRLALSAPAQPAGGPAAGGDGGMAAGGGVPPELMALLASRGNGAPMGAAR